MNRLVAVVVVVLAFGVASADSLNVRTVGAVATSHLAVGVAITGSHACVADLDGGLRVINVANPAAPVEVGSLDTAGYAEAVGVTGSIALVAWGYSGLRVVDISDPAHPAQIGAAGLPDYANGIVVVPGRALVTAEEAGLTVFDISNPRLPSVSGVFDTPGAASGVALDGYFAYVADLSGGLRVANVNAVPPVEVGSYVPADLVYSVTVAGARAYLGCMAGLRIVDVSSPESPTELGFLPTTSAVASVCVVGNLAYVGARNAGLLIVDVTDPAAPALVAYHRELPAYGVTVAGGYIYAASWSYGLRIYQYYGAGLAEATVAAERTAAGRGATVLHPGELAGPGTGLFDVTGKRVRAAGAPGVYFRREAGGAGRRIVVVR